MANDNSRQVTLPFRLIRNLVVIELKINNKGPFNFILDTGVGTMIITDPQLADSIHVTKRTVKIPGLGEGQDYEAFLTSILNIEIPGLVSRNVSTAILKKDHFGLSGYAGIPIHGLLGYEFFSRLAVKISFADSSLTVSPPLNMRLFRKAVRIPITIEGNKPYMEANVIYANGTQRKSKLIIDLGAGHPLSLENIQDKHTLQKKFINANLGMGLNGLIDGSVSRITAIEFGKYRIRNVITSFPNDTIKLSATPRDGNLGMGILRKFNIIFDYDNEAMYLKPGYDFGGRFEHDMSGLTYYAGGREYKNIIIDRIEPGSAGEKAGLRKDDEIVSINFKHAENMSLQQIDELFRSKDGRSILLDVYRDKKHYRIILTLERRI